MDRRCPLPCPLSGSGYSLVCFGKEKTSFQSRARVAKKNLLFPYPCLGCMIGPSLPGTFPTECPVSSFKPRTNWDGRSSCITLFLEQLPAKSISLPFLLLLVTKSCLTLVTPWTIACQAPLSVGFPSREYWSGLSFSSPGDLPYSEIKSTSPAL